MFSLIGQASLGGTGTSLMQNLMYCGFMPNNSIK
jgi:hypothetical protein